MPVRAGAPGIVPDWRRALASVRAVSSSENSSGPIALVRFGATLPARAGFRISKTLAHFVHLMRLACAPPKRVSS